MHWIDLLSAPEDWLGAVVPVDLEVATGKNAVMCISHLTAYPTGFTFHLTALTREEPGVLCAETLQAGQRQAEDLDEIHIHLGVEFSDGRQAHDLTTWISAHGGRMAPPAFPQRNPPDPKSEIALRDEGHETNDREFSGASWVWPLPPPGRLTFHCGWPAAGLPVTATTIDADLLLNQVETAKPLWEPAK